MKRIFLTLAIAANLLTGYAVYRGLTIREPEMLTTVLRDRIGSHMLIGLAALTFATFVHAICLTYFMGTGRWLEETRNAYKLDNKWYLASKQMKYRLIMGMMVCFGFLIGTGALGAVADPTTQAGFGEPFGFSDATIHLGVAVLTAIVNLLSHVAEYTGISRNSQLIEAVMTEVRRIREERGLPTD